MSLCWQKVAMVAVSRRIPDIYYYERRWFCKIVKLGGVTKIAINAFVH